MEDVILCCDWGTSSFRIRLVDIADYSVLAEVKNDRGIGITYKLASEGGEKNIAVYMDVLRAGIEKLSENGRGELNSTPIVISGMGSSSIGIADVPYANLPFPVDGSEVTVKVIKDPEGLQNPVILLGGVRSRNDVMRGEETQMAGLMHTSELNFSGMRNLLFILPGTHSKHIFVSQDIMVDFRTFMTGEMFQTISLNTILRDSVTSGTDFKSARDTHRAFRDGVDRSSEYNLLHSLFHVRTNELFKKYTKEQNAFFLSGLLVGSELRQIDLKRVKKIVLCSDEKLLGLYRAALETLGLGKQSVFISPPLLQKATIVGQTLIYNRLKEQLL